jgi:hypothetical protein
MLHPGRFCPRGKTTQRFTRALRRPQFERGTLNASVRSQASSIRYNALMTRDQVKEILDRVLTWPAERQADVAHVVEIMEEQDKSEVRLTDAQAAEVRRRLAEKNPKTFTLAEFNERLRRRYGV